ncbi:MAG: acyl-CoA dehydrogenase family protein [Candidatus Bathyarchaeia archaeon]|nr:acyl-CoA dehydrogenase family protein [Candidatus Bathyarchaeia archaeon]
MDFELTAEQKMIVEAASDIAKDFGPEYWREKDKNHEFPEDFWKTLVEAGFPSIVIPEKYGGSEMGMFEMILAMETLTSEGCGLAGTWFLVLSPVFGGLSIVKHGDENQKEKYLSKIAKGMEFCLALTEPDAGTNTLNTKTMAVKEGDEYVINGQKMFISGADRAKGMVLITRTTPLEEVPKRTLGLSLFLVDLPNSAIEIIPIEKHGINYSKTFEVYISDLRVSEESLLGEADKGWYLVLDILNPERMSFSAASCGIGLLAIQKAVEYAKERTVFRAPIGSHQAIQFPLAEAKAKIEAARLLNYKAAWLYDKGQRCGAEANMAKVAAVEAGTEAVYHAMQTFGGYGYAVEYDVERWWREVNLIRLAPVTHQMALAFIGEHVLGLPKSY